MTPLCGYSLDYLVQLKDESTGIYSPLPSWLVNMADLDFLVQTDDPSNVGIHHLSIIGSVPLNFMDPTYEEELIISILIQPCTVSDFTAVPISNVVYTIGSIDIESETYSFVQ